MRALLLAERSDAAGVRAWIELARIAVTELEYETVDRRRGDRAAAAELTRAIRRGGVGCVHVFEVEAGEPWLAARSRLAERAIPPTLVTSFGLEAETLSSRAGWRPRWRRMVRVAQAYGGDRERDAELARADGFRGEAPLPTLFHLAHLPPSPPPPLGPTAIHLLGEGPPFGRAAVALRGMESACEASAALRRLPWVLVDPSESAWQIAQLAARRLQIEVRAERKLDVNGTGFLIQLSTRGRLSRRWAEAHRPGLLGVASSFARPWANFGNEIHWVHPDEPEEIRRALTKRVVGRRSAGMGQSDSLAPEAIRERVGALLRAALMR